MDHGQLEALGIWASYHDAFGNHYQLSEDAAAQLLAAMDVAPGEPVPDGRDAVLVTGPHRGAWVPAGELELEDGGRVRVDGPLPAELPLGYHRLHRDDGITTTIISSPGIAPAHPERIWGWSLQLYSVRSERSWGVGDLDDLHRLATWSAEQGARTLLVNPVDAVVNEFDREDSPYFPSSRRFRDPLYLAVDRLPGIEQLGTGELERLAALARGDGQRIDRARVVDAKMAALEQLWELQGRRETAAGFAAFVAEQGASLTRFATFELLSELHGGGFRRWPEELRDPDAPAVAAAAEAHADRVHFHRWVQWLLDEQLRAAGAAAPLMRDLPIGVDPEGADAWEWQNVLATDTTVGAPPDELGPEGQDWLVPAFVPWKLRQAAYRPFIETLRSAFRHTAALRIDHVLGLFRLFWIPPAGPRSGTYVSQDRKALLDILALEAHRAGAYVVGEDLGTVMDGVREELVGRGMLRYRVLWFEDQEPAHWDRRGLGSISTHDLPSVGGLWTRTELEVLRELGAHVDEERIERMRSDLARRADIPDQASVEEACVGAARLLGGAGCDVVVAQLEDALGTTHRINVPGTDTTQRPDNWCIPLPVLLDDLPTHPTARRVAGVLRAARPLGQGH
ncbi:MAG: 4-alpha-glucanotransferase [Nitriliruptoraceae bacterium]